MGQANIFTVWVVRCPKDAPELAKSWQPALHPHIYHLCKTCGAAVHSERYDERKHEIRQASTKRRRGESIEAVIDRLFDNAPLYLVAPPTL